MISLYDGSIPWLEWQDAVKAEKVVPRDVMAMFQATKHLMRAPKAGDRNILGTGPLDPKFIVVDTSPKPKFSWSPSSLADFDTCPYKFAQERYYKTVPRSKTAASIWGDRVHKAAEQYMKGVQVEDPEAFETVRPYCQVLERLPGERLIEHRIALSRDFTPCEWDEAEGRMVLDLGFENGDSLKLYDWKTGNQKDGLSQMQIYALALALLHPDVQTIEARYIWLKTGKTTGFEVTRRDLLPIFKDLKDRIARCREAWENENFSMRKNGLCRQYCGALSCPHNGGKR